MAKKARAVMIETVDVISAMRDGDTYWLFVSLEGPYAYDSFKALPANVEYEGRLYSKTAYNSDIMRAYYRTGVSLAVAR